MLTEYLAGEGFETTTVNNGGDGIAAAMTDRLQAVILDVMISWHFRHRRAATRYRQQKRGSHYHAHRQGQRCRSRRRPGNGRRRLYRQTLLSTRTAGPLARRAAASDARYRQSRTQAPAIHGLEFSRARREAAWQGQAIELTATEFNMLGSLLEAGDTVMTKDELSREVLGRVRAAYDRGIDVHHQQFAAQAGRGRGGGALENRDHSRHRLSPEGTIMRRMVFWKILIGFWITTVLISEAVWLMFHLAAPCPATTAAGSRQCDQQARSPPPSIIAQDAQPTGIRGTRLKSWPSFLQQQITMVPGSAQSAAATVQGRDGQTYSIMAKPLPPETAP